MDTCICGHPRYAHHEAYHPERLGRCLAGTCKCRRYCNARLHTDDVLVDDECGCVLPEQDCPTCRKAAAPAEMPY